MYLEDCVQQLSEQFVERVLQRSYTSIGNNSALDVSPDEHVAQALLPAASSVAAVAPLAIRGVTEERVRARQRSFEVSKLDLADDDREIQPHVRADQATVPESPRSPPAVRPSIRAFLCAAAFRAAVDILGDTWWPDPGQRVLKKWGT